MQGYFLYGPCTRGALCRVFIEHDKIGGREGREGTNFCSASLGRRTADADDDGRRQFHTNHEYSLHSERADGKERRQVDGGSLGRSPSAVAATTTTYHHPLYWGVVNIANSRQRRTQKQEARGWSMESSYRVGLILQGLEHSFSKGVPFAPFIN